MTQQACLLVEASRRDSSLAIESLIVIALQQGGFFKAGVWGSVRAALKKYEDLLPCSKFLPSPATESSEYANESPRLTEALLEKSFMLVRPGESASALLDQPIEVSRTAKLPSAISPSIHNENRRKRRDYILR